MSPASQQADTPGSAAAPKSRKRGNFKASAAQPAKRVRAPKKETTPAPKNRANKKNDNLNNDAPSITKAKAGPKTAAKGGAKKKANAAMEAEENDEEDEDEPMGTPSAFADPSTDGFDIPNNASSMVLQLPGRKDNGERVADNHTPTSVQTAHHRVFSNSSIPGTSNPVANMGQNLHRQSLRSPSMVAVPHGHSRASSCGSAGPLQSVPVLMSNARPGSISYSLAGQYHPDVHMFQPGFFPNASTTAPPQQPSYGNHRSPSGGFPVQVNIQRMPEFPQTQQIGDQQRINSSGYAGPVNVNQAQLSESMQRGMQQHTRSASGTPATMATYNNMSTQGRQGSQQMMMGQEMPSFQASPQVRQVPGQYAPNLQQKMASVPQQMANEQFPQPQGQNAYHPNQPAPILPSSEPAMPAADNAMVEAQASMQQLNPYMDNGAFFFDDPFPLLTAIRTYGRSEVPAWLPKPVVTDTSPRNYAGILWPFYYRTIAVEDGNALYTFTDDDLNVLQETFALDRDGQYDWDAVTNGLIDEYHAAGASAPARRSMPVIASSTNTSESRGSSLLPDAANNTSLENYDSAATQSAHHSRQSSACEAIEDNPGGYHEPQGGA